MNQSTAGIDVGKRELDVSVDGDRARRFANTSAGVAELVGWLGSQGPLLAVCEATGGYEALVVQALRQVGVPVHIAHPTRSGPLLGPVVIRPRPTVWTPWCSLGMARSSNLLPPWPRRPTEASCRTSCAVGSSWSASAPRRRTVCPAFTIQPPRIPYEDTSPGWTRRSECWMISTGNFTRNSWSRTWSFADRLRPIAACPVWVSRPQPPWSPGCPSWAGVTERLWPPGVASPLGLGTAVKSAATDPPVADAGQYDACSTWPAWPQSPQAGAAADLRSTQGLGDFYRQLRQRGKPGKVALVAVMRKLMLQLNAVARRGTPWTAQFQPTT